MPCSYLNGLFDRSDLVRFYGMSTIVGHFMPNHFYTYIKYMIFKHILLIAFLNELSSFFLHTVGFT